MRRAREGRLTLRCRYHMTDDYAHDNATNCGKMERPMVAYLRREFDHPLEAEIDGAYAAGAMHADVEERMEDLRRLREKHADEERRRGRGLLSISPCEFRTKSGAAYFTDEERTRGKLFVHSNLCYEFEILAEGPVRPGAKREV